MKVISGYFQRPVVAFRGLQRPMPEKEVGCGGVRVSINVMSIKSVKCLYQQIHDLFLLRQKISNAC